MGNISIDSALTLTQALQLVGLAPCLFIIFLLALAIPRNSQVIIPAFYFLALACGFALPLANILLPHASRGLTAGLLFGESTLVTLSFLLILQFLMGRVPPLPYWLVLAIPFIGGGMLIHASMVQDSASCLRDSDCFDVVIIRTLYNVLSASFLFLLLVYYASRFKGLGEEGEQKKHKYWLMVALIALHLFALAINLANLSHHITLLQAQFIETVLRLTFIYVVITSLFRVFYPGLVPQIIQTAPMPSRAYNPEADASHVEALKALLHDRHIYREMRLNRARLAKKVGIGEHHLSRVINHHFGMSFNELINGYRIEDAKRRLKSETTPITTIAFEVGFNSIASFNRVFKQKVGVSPTEYRQGIGG